MLHHLFHKIYITFSTKTGITCSTKFIITCYSTFVITSHPKKWTQKVFEGLVRSREADHFEFIDLKKNVPPTQELFQISRQEDHFIYMKLIFFSLDHV